LGGGGALGVVPCQAAIQLVHRLALIGLVLGSGGLGRGGGGLCLRDGG
jgi:hypothetical protein